MIFFGVILLLDVISECFNAFEIAVNDNFDFVFACVYCILVFLLFVALGFQAYYWCARDSPTSRGLIQWSFLAASIINFLIAIWIIVYILCIYKKDKVVVPVYEHDDHPNTEEGEGSIKVTYKSYMTKSNWIIVKCIQPVLFGGAFLLFFYGAREWARRHEKQQRAHG